MLDRLDLSAVTSAAGSAAWLLAATAGHVKIGSRYLTGTLAAIQHAQQQLDAERAKTREALDRTVEEAREALDGVERELQEAVDQARTLADDAARLKPSRGGSPCRGIYRMAMQQTTGPTSSRIAIRPNAPQQETLHTCAGERRSATTVGVDAV
ncbi:hypothetical protein BH18ACT7_BH18ACT7_09850 [soil metagenome]